MPIPAPTIRLASTDADYGTARALFTEYAQWLKVDLCFQGFGDELATLPGKYALPDGRLFLAFGAGGEPAGCVALRPLAPTIADAAGTHDGDDGACELKRLWVRLAFRGTGLGRTLTQVALDAAREIGYRSIKLDTLADVMPNAVAMYRGFGFVECAPYYHNPIAGALYMERSL